MSVEYMGLSEIHGPLVVLDGVKDAFFEEIVEIKVNGKIRTGRIIEITGETVIVQVFENTDQFSLTNLPEHGFWKSRLMMPLAKEILGRTFNGSGRPIDGLGDMYPGDAGGRQRKAH